MTPDLDMAPASAVGTRLAEASAHTFTQLCRWADCVALFARRSH